MDINLRLGQRVVSVDFSKRNVILDHKEVVQFDGLIVATGGKPRIPEQFQLFKDIMLTLKTPLDARMWVEKLRNVESVLIIGGDLTSLSLTKALLKLDRRVKFILNEDAFWPVPLNEEIYRAARRDRWGGPNIGTGGTAHSPGATCETENQPQDPS